MQQRRACRDCGARAASTPPPFATRPRRIACGCSMPARRDDVRHARRAREMRRPPLRHVPHAVDVADVGASERSGQRTADARAEKPLRERAPRRSGPARRRTRSPSGGRRRQRRPPVGGRRHHFDVDAGALQALAQAEHRGRRSAVGHAPARSRATRGAPSRRVSRDPGRSARAAASNMSSVSRVCLAARSGPAGSDRAAPSARRDRP